MNFQLALQNISHKNENVRMVGYTLLFTLTTLAGKDNFF